MAKKGLKRKAGSV